MDSPDYGHISPGSDYGLSHTMVKLAFGTSARKEPDLGIHLTDQAELSRALGHSELWKLAGIFPTLSGLVLPLCCLCRPSLDCPVSHFSIFYTVASAGAPTRSIAEAASTLVELSFCNNTSKLLPDLFPQWSTELLVTSNRAWVPSSCTSPESSSLSQSQASYAVYSND
ncbi:hypothetical protein M8818_002290 [Zalaria obscura]|uniref:Uncharacterized protein n=1 Tax=Zalaria obscura TaxID=2024903 RepID=A0ACC3SHD9_9PEZI